MRHTAATALSSVLALMGCLDAAESIVDPLADYMHSSVGVDSGFSKRLVRKRTLVVDTDLGYFEQVAKWLHTRNPRSNPGAGAHRYGRCEHVVWRKCRRCTGKLHRPTAIGIIDQGDDGTSEAMFARTHRDQGIQFVLGVGNQRSCICQRFQIEITLG